MRPSSRALAVLIAAIGVFALHSLRSAPPAAANVKQVAIIEDDVHLLQFPLTTLQSFRSLGAQMVRVFVTWAQIAPDPFSTSAPSGFDASDPAAYPAGAWDRWDAVDRYAQQLGLKLDFVLTGGSPLWADGPGIPEEAKTNPNRAWFPSARDFGEFVTAAGRRYSGSFPDPQNPGQNLPRVSFWSIWNEPNFGEDLAPEAIDGSRVLSAPRMYRNLVGAAWSSLGSTGHSHDRIVIGEFAARGVTGRVTPSHPQGLPGNFAQTKPLQFLRNLYCVNRRLQPLSGNSAKAVGCPTNRSASRRFRAQNPGLFSATGFSDHPYPQNLPPTMEHSRDPDFAAFNEIPRLEGQLDRIMRIYGGHTGMPIYNDEYGYITHPPNRGRYVSPSTAAYYLNWAEYLSWRSPRIASTMQYLLYDPAPTVGTPEYGGFSSGLLTSSGRPKPAYGAYRLPLFIPNRTERRGHSIEVWGGVRPAVYAGPDTHSAQSVQIQFQRHSRGAWRTLKVVKITNSRGYFTASVKFPSSGEVRLGWTYPAHDPLLATGTVHSRYAHVDLR